MQKINRFALGALLLGITIGTSQQANAATDEVDYKPFTAGVEVGTLGPGVSIGWRLSDHFGLRGGANYLSYNKDGKEVSDVKFNSKLRLLSAPIGLDFYPWVDSTFRITGGVLFNGNRFTGAVPAQSGLFIPIGNTGPAGVDSAAIGDLNLKVDQNVVAPYIGVGYSWFFGKEKRWSLSGEVGLAYAGSPDVALSNGNAGVDVNIDNQVAIERQQIEDDLDKYTVYPIVKIGLSFSF